METYPKELEFLFKVLEENGWKTTHAYNEHNGCEMWSDFSIKNDVVIQFNDVFNKDPQLLIGINRKLLFSTVLSQCEVFSDHIEFKYAGCAVMIRLTDAYVLMEYNQE